MKLLFICEGINASSIVAQPWKHVIEIARRIKGLDIQTKIISDKLNGRQEEEEILGVPVQRVKKRVFFDTKLLSQAINQEDADVVNWHCSDVWSAVYFWRLRKKVKANIVWTLHSGILSIDDLKNLNASDYLHLYKFWNNVLNAVAPKFLVKKWLSVPLLRHVITLSKRTAERLKQYGLNDEDVTPISSGVDVDSFKPSGNTAGDFTVLYFGPLSSLRGVDVLLSAFNLVRKSLPDARLILLARESDSDSSLFKKAKNLENVVVIAGILNRERLIRHLSSASVIVLPFKFWPQVDCPLTVVEAMAMEKAVVTTSIGAIPEVVRNWENGVLIPSKDSKELAKVVAKLLNTPSQCEEIGRNARAYVKRFHDWNIIVKDTLGVLSSSMDRG
jgi:glycosyltransferase involved in cell wall biosynthesis